jgi:enolase
VLRVRISEARLARRQYNQLLRIEEQLGGKQAKYTGKAAPKALL